MRARNKIITFFVVLFLNFSALGIGMLATSGGVVSPWYHELNQAPWTPPGWMFGVAWTTIMICFAVYVTILWFRVDDSKTFLKLYGVQWLLNVIWNPLFFSLHWVSIALCSLTILLILVWYMMIRYHTFARAHSIWVIPYALWLVVAASLNAYICWYN